MHVWIECTTDFSVWTQWKLSNNLSIKLYSLFSLEHLIHHYLCLHTLIVLIIILFQFQNDALSVIMNTFVLALLSGFVGLFEKKTQEILYLLILNDYNDGRFLWAMLFWFWLNTMHYSLRLTTSQYNNNIKNWSYVTKCLCTYIANNTKL